MKKLIGLLTVCFLFSLLALGLVPDSAETEKRIPDFLARLRAIYGDKVLTVSGADLVSSDRSRD